MAVLAEAGVDVVGVPLTNETQSLLNARAMVAVLESGHLGGVSLGGTRLEPLSESQALG